MSDLQLGLVVIGVLVIVGVYAFNRLQERKFRRRMENSVQERPGDVLTATQDARPGERAERIEHIEPAERVEPRVGRQAAAPAPDEPAPQSMERTLVPLTSAQAGVTVPLGSPIDYTCDLESATPLPAAALGELLKSMHAIGKPVSLNAWHADAAEWIAWPSNAPLAITRVEATLQLADRGGPVNRVQLSTMRDLMREFAEHCGASCRCPEIDAAAQAAVELDRFCAEVDMSIGCSVVPAAGSGFAGTKVRGLLESAGFALDASGRFVLRSDEGRALLSVEDIDGHAFSAERLRTAPIGGLVLTLDVPRVPSHGRVFDRMIEIGRHLAQALDGTVVDDNRAALTDGGVRLIRLQVNELHATMQAQGIPAGEAMAERLFS